MASVTRNSTWRVLALPELLDIIFRCSDDASNASHARVCSKWSDVALNVLWEHVGNISRLLGMLGPMTVAGNGQLKFRRFLTVKDWTRFGRYSYRIKGLSYRFSTDLIHPCVFDELARSRMSLEILPNMHTLLWDGSVESAVVFMHKKVKSFTVKVSANSNFGFLQDIGARMPNLIHLDLRSDSVISAIGSDIIALLSNLSSLQKLTVPRFCFTSKIAEAASRNRNLKFIDALNLKSDVGSEDFFDFKPILLEEAYQSLTELKITVSYHDAAVFLANPFAPKRLQKLRFNSQTDESPANISDLLTTIAENCKLLTSLSLASSTECKPGVTDESSQKEDCITLDSLRPLFKCSTLTSLEILHQNPIKLQLDDVEEIAKVWLNIEYMDLNHWPGFPWDSDLTLRALLPFARHCPKLHTLGLFLETNTQDLELLSKGTNVHPPFRALRHLKVGASFITQEGDVTLFLSQICPLGCTVEGEDVEAEEDEGYDRWQKVNELLPLVTKLRMEERERAKLSKRDVDSQEGYH